MEKRIRKHQHSGNLSIPETMSVPVIYEKQKKREIRTITTHDLVVKFPDSTAGKVYKKHHIAFVRCLKAFLEQHFEGIVEPMFNTETIDGLSPKEIKHIEILLKNQLKKSD